MLGIIANSDEKKIVSEFFQLFKVPWEFYAEGKNYDIVITTENHIHNVNTKILIHYSSNNNQTE